MTTSPSITNESLLELYERGHSLVSIAERIGGSVANLQARLLAGHGKDRMAEAVTRNVESSIERAAIELDDIHDSDQAVRLSAIKAKIELRKWQASMTSSKYKPSPADRGALSGSLVINIVGMNGATLRVPNVIEG